MSSVVVMAQERAPALQLLPAINPKLALAPAS